MTSASSTACAACNPYGARVKSVIARCRIDQLSAKGGTAMKLITAIIRPDKLDELVQVLIASRVPGLTVTEIRGFGRQYGRLAAGQAAAATGLLPKIRLDIVVLDDEAETIAEAIAKQARTETIG